MIVTFILHVTNKILVLLANQHNILLFLKTINTIYCIPKMVFKNKENLHGYIS